MATFIKNLLEDPYFKRIQEREGEDVGGGAYKAPEFDIKRIKALTQEQLAPTVSGVRRAIQRVQAGRAPTPTAMKERLRGAIRGGGEAIGAAQAGATRAALALYGPEHQAAEREALFKYQEALREERKLEEKKTAQGRIDPRSETYKEAQARLSTPSAASLRFAARPFTPFGATRTVATPTTDYMSRI